jgi:predicted dehydrogenase
MKNGLIQAGIIGSGMVSQEHMKNFTTDERTELRWITDLNPEALAKSAEKFNVPKTTADYQDILNDDEVDVIVICTPPSTHLKIGLDVIGAGKHLLMEKPLTTSMSETRRLVKAAAQHPELKISGCTARHARLQPKYAFIKKFIDDGKLGDIYYIHHRSVTRQSRGGVEYNPTAKWFLNRNIAGGGPMFDWGVYDLSFHLGLLNEPRFIKADGFCINGLDKVDPGTKVFTVEEHGCAMMTFEGGLKYYWERASNANMESPNQTAIYGTKGGLKFAFCSWDDPTVEFFYVDDDGKGKAQSEKFTVDMEGHSGDMETLGTAYIDYLCGAGPVPMPLERELINLNIIHQVYRAAGW